MTVADLTIIVTTSPIPSMPSTALLEALLKSFDNVVVEQCRTIIVCDGIGEVVDGKPNWKRSRVNPEHVLSYAATSTT